MKSKYLMFFVVSLIAVVLGYKVDAYAANRPGTFSVTSPSNNATYESGDSVTVRWETSSEADYYIFIINDETEGEHIIDTTTSSTSYRISSSYLTAGHRYKIFIQAKNDHPYATTSNNTVYFSVDREKTVSRPGSFSVTSPSNNETFEDGDSVTVRWGSSSDADYYLFIVNDETEGYHIIDTSTSSTSYRISSSYLEEGHKYKIFVQAINDNPYATTSNNTVYFSVKKEVERPGTFNVTSPSNGEKINEGDDVIVRWNSSTNAEYYSFIINDETAGYHIIETTTYGTSYTISSWYLTAGHTYKIFVQAKNDNPYATTSDNTVCFSVESGKKVALDVTKKTLLIGEKLTLKLQNAIGTIKWKSSMSSVAAVTDEGVVTAMGEGSATITATYNDTKYTCKITVKKSEPKLNVSNVILEVGKTKKVKLTGAVAVLYKSSKKSVAKVSVLGKITAKKVGSATITVTDLIGNTYKCKVTVIDKDTTEDEANQNDEEEKNISKNNAVIPLYDTSVSIKTDQVIGINNTKEDISIVIKPTAKSVNDFQRLTPYLSLSPDRTIDSTLDAEMMSRIIWQFDPADGNWYKGGSRGTDNTYCNFFAADCAQAAGCFLPGGIACGTTDWRPKESEFVRRTASSTGTASENPVYVYLKSKGLVSTDKNILYIGTVTTEWNTGLDAWMDNVGVNDFGYKEIVGDSTLVAAQEAQKKANKGYFVVGITQKSTGYYSWSYGHVFVVHPNASVDSKHIAISQAGGKTEINALYDLMSNYFGAQGCVKYYYYAGIE